MTDCSKDDRAARHAGAGRVLLLLAVSLTAAGLLRFDLQSSSVPDVLLQWTAVLVTGVVALRVFRAWRRSPFGRARELDVIFRTAVAAAVGSAHVLFLLHLTVPSQPYEVERYVRALALTTTAYLFANAAVFFVLITLPYLATGRLRASVLAGLLVAATLHAVHAGKYLILQQHLYTWDHMLAGDLLEVLPLTFGPAGVSALAVLGAALVAVVVVVALREQRTAPLGRRARALGAGLLATTLVLGVTSLRSGAADQDPSEYFPLWNRHSYNSHHNKSGLCFALLRGTRHLALNRPPPGYSAKAMQRIEEAFPRAAEHQDPPNADVILYMLESLSDGAAYGLQYEDDPIPNFHALAERGTRARLVVPIYGGNTPNTEFEVLTGLSRVRPWPHDLAYAYRQWIRDKTAALPWVFRDWGYRTAVVSGATSKYFGEAEAYPRLGFHEFRALGDRPESARKYGLVSDEAVVDELIRMLSAAPRPPWFLAVTTDATHGPYRGDHDPQDARFVPTNPDLSQALKDVAQDYARAIHHADKALGRLVRHLEKRERPTVLLVYGDHKPAIPEYFDAGLFRTGWPGAVIDKYSTPLAIWTNFDSPPSKTPALLSANFLSLELFARLGVHHPPSTFHFAQQVYGRFSVVSRVIGDRAGRFHEPHELEGTDAELVRDYGFVKYHTLIGGRR